MAVDQQLQCIIGESLSLNDFDNNEEFVLKLEKAVEKLCNQDFNKLLSILYRIDVDENVIKKILAEDSQPSISNRITKEIIKRQQEKVKFRKKNRT